MVAATIAALNRIDSDAPRPLSRGINTATPGLSILEHTPLYRPKSNISTAFCSWTPSSTCRFYATPVPFPRAH